MEKEEILRHIDHTELKAYATWNDIKRLCDEATEYKTASVCVPPYFVEKIRRNYKNLNICTVIGFPLGYNTSETKVFETKKAIMDGADEVDMVINISMAKEHLFCEITDEIKAVRAASNGKILKVIIETCYLDDDEKKALCRCVTEAGADYIKTSTGFGTSGANIDDIKIFKENIGENVKMKAAGGVKSRSDLEMFLEAGCDRIGTSSALKILTEEKE